MFIFQLRTWRAPRWVWLRLSGRSPLLTWRGPGIRRRPGKAGSQSRGGCRSSPGWAGCSWSGGRGGYTLGPGADGGCGQGPEGCSHWLEGGCSHWLAEGCKCWQEGCRSLQEGCKHSPEQGYCKHFEACKADIHLRCSEVVGKAGIRPRCKRGQLGGVHDVVEDTRGRQGGICRENRVKTTS